MAAVAMLVAGSAMSQSWYTPAVKQKTEELLRAMTLQEKIDFISGNWMFSEKNDRLGIKSMKMSDGPQGLGTHGNSTAYPCAVSLAASWNGDLAYEYGTSLARDCRARGVNILLGPGVNIYRAPMNGRNFEYMGEDPFLASRTAVNYIKGVQDHGVMATVKHFALNNSDYDRHHISNDADDRTLNEIYFPAFRAAIQEAGVGAVMSSYNLVNGVYTSEYPNFFPDIIRKSWGFNGLVVSDWGALHHTVPAMRAGVALEMPSPTVFNANDIEYYLKTGDVSTRMIDEKVRSILNAQIGFGFLHGKEADTSIPLNNAESSATALKVAREAIVLLKNKNNILPLNPRRYKRIVVTGENATGYVRGGGSGSVTPFHFVSLLEGIRQAAGENTTVDFADPWLLLPQIIYTDASMKEKGLKAEYFGNTELSGAPIRSCIEAKAVHTWPDPANFKDLRLDNFSARWTGIVCADETADYELTLGADDGYRLFIDGKKVIDNWTAGAYRQTIYKTRFNAGEKHDIRVEYYQGTGGADVKFKLQRADHKANAALLDKYFAKADLIIACLGYNSMSEGEDFDRPFELQSSDSTILQGAIASRKPIIGLINSGGSVEMQGWEPKVNGLLWLGYLGQEAGTAVADVLYGKVNPSGKLPMTFEKRWSDNPVHDSYYDTDGDKHVTYTEGIFVGYRGYDKLKREVQYPFGYGLSYTSFAVRNLEIGKQNEDGTVDVRCSITNTGSRAGAQVAQIYVGKAEASPVPRPEKELRGYKKVFLQPGESKAIDIRLPKEAFMYYANRKFQKDAGVYNVMLGFSSRDIRLKDTIAYK